MLEQKIKVIPSDPKNKTDFLEQIIVSTTTKSGSTDKEIYFNTTKRITVKKTKKQLIQSSKR